MSNKGIKHLNQGGYGDQIVRININVPKKSKFKRKRIIKRNVRYAQFQSTGYKQDEKNFFKRFGL